MKGLFTVLVWLLGISLILLGLGFMASVSLFGGACFLLAGVLLIPLSRRALSAITKRDFSTLKSSVAAIVMLFIGFLLIGSEGAKRAEQQAADFESNRDEIVSSMGDVLAAGNYQEVLDESEKYVAFSDSELEAIRGEALAQIENQKTIAKTQTLETELKDAITNNTAQAVELNKELIELHPDNAEYLAQLEPLEQKLAEEEKVEAEKQKLAKTMTLKSSLEDAVAINTARDTARAIKFNKELIKLHPDNAEYLAQLEPLEQKLAEEEKAEAEAKKLAEAAKETEEKIKAQFHPWSGAHISLEKFIQASMNDPDSYEHVETGYWERKDHLVVQTKFRGKNAFGGVITQTMKVKVSLEGTILEVIE